MRAWEYAVLAAVLFFLAGCQHPLVDASDRFINGPMGQYLAANIKADPALEQSDQEAMMLELWMYQELVLESKRARW